MKELGNIVCLLSGHCPSLSVTLHDNIQHGLQILLPYPCLRKVVIAALQSDHEKLSLSVHQGSTNLFISVGLVTSSHKITDKFVICLLLHSI